MSVFLVWLKGSPDPTRFEAIKWHAPIATLTRDGKPDPRRLCEFELSQEEAQLNLHQLREKYPLSDAHRDRVLKDAKS